ncbi:MULTISPECIES: hypothetical protein [Streptomyces]|uniref:hypothetical protein n=1 Tax=Streptomyces TaxID=1883 RepID=UPI0004CA0DF8|nr:hypothetical protein [Streptomyces virginiae]
MAHDMEKVREMAARSGLPLDYLARLNAAESTPDDPHGEGALLRQMIVVFDHYLAKSLTGDSAVEDLAAFGFTETAAALASRQAS